MKTLTITALITLAIGTYPAYAHRLVNAAQTLVCNIVPAPYQPVVTFVIILVAIIAIAQRGQGK
jgi:choline-glycine betaine transporter